MLAATLLATGVLGWLWLPGMPGGGAPVGADYAFFLPNLLAGAFWHLHNPIWAMPWFTPAQCGGFALHADPQGLYLSLTQALAILLGPVPAVRLSLLAYGAAGGLGAAWLARSGFGLSRWAALLAGVLFMFNGFFAVRMMVGHLGFAPFMLTPAIAASALGPRGRWPAETCRLAAAAALFAAQIQGGMAALLAPCQLCIAMVLAMRALAGTEGAVLPWLRFLVGAACGLCISAAKLAGMVALMGQLPRDAYGLPGFDTLAETSWVAARALFLAPSPDMPAALHHVHLHPFLHEFDYGVGPAALLLLLAWAASARRGAAWPTPRQAALWAWLGLLLVVPLALNTYGPHWSAALKLLPILRQSTLLLRWFAAYILPATLGAAIALDRIAARGISPGLLCGAASLGTVAALALTVGGGSGFRGQFDPGPVQRAWQRMAESGQAPPIGSLAPAPADPRDFQAFLAAQGALAHGASSLDCYQPLFGYDLENFPRGALHAGDILDSAGGRLNLKNPACYVFPDANACRPGDAFRQDQAGAAGDFAAWHAFAWRKPLWAQAADWLGDVSTALVLLAAGAALVAWRRIA